MYNCTSKNTRWWMDSWNSAGFAQCHRLEMVNIPPIKMVMTGGLFMALFYPHYRLLTSINWDMTPTTMFFLNHNSEWNCTPSGQVFSLPKIACESRWPQHNEDGQWDIHRMYIYICGKMNFLQLDSWYSCSSSKWFQIWQLGSAVAALEAIGGFRMCFLRRSL